MKLHDESIEVYQYNPETEMRLIASIVCKSNKFSRGTVVGMHRRLFPIVHLCVINREEESR